jgi:hypothetical protein
MSIAAFLAIEESEILLFSHFCLRQFFSPLFGFFWFIPGFVEFDQVLLRFQRAVVLVGVPQLSVT